MNNNHNNTAEHKPGFTCKDLTKIMGSRFLLHTNPTTCMEKNIYVDKKVNNKDCQHMRDMAK